MTVSKWLAIVVVFICGCTPSNEGKQIVSSRFGVCINLPRGADYFDHNQFVDYDTAVLRINGSTVEVMIGGHPRFSRAAIKKVVQATTGFEVLGEEKSDGLDKLLFGYNRRNDPVAGFHGPENELVMFSSSDLTPIKHLLTESNVVADCRRKFSDPRGARKP